MSIMESYSAKKKKKKKNQTTDPFKNLDESQRHSAEWKSQSQKNAYCIIPFVWHFRKDITKGQISGAWGWVGWRSEYKGLARGRFEGWQNYCVLIMLLITQIYTCVKNSYNSTPKTKFNFIPCWFKNNSKVTARQASLSMGFSRQEY